MATENQLKTLTKKKQSPINIIDHISTPKYLPPLQFIGHFLNDGIATLTNNGKYPVVELSGNRIPSVVKCGPLSDDEYEFHSAHFHWGEDDACGSEHSLDDTWFSMEAHALHWNRKYRTFEECLKYEDGLCVLAYFLQIKNQRNSDDYTALDKITDKLSEIHEYGAKTSVPANSLCWMRAASESSYYYYYRGSYNHFDCPECVIWIVFPRTLAVRADQVAEFRKLKDAKGEEIGSNLCKRQPLGSRKIYKAVPCYP